MFVLLNIRKLQAFRMLKGLGFVYWIFLAFLVVIFSKLAFQYTSDNRYSLICTVLICAGFYSLHSFRNDKPFIFQHLENSSQNLFFEYLALLLPFSAGLLFSEQWWLFPILIVAVYFISFSTFTYKEKTYFKHLSRFIPAENFELLSGFRKQLFLLLIIYLLALGLVFFKIATLVILWLFVVAISNYFNECEPLHILQKDNLNSKSFLKWKIISNLKIVAIFLLPPVLLNFAFNPEYWVFHLFFIPTQLSLITFTICLKYSNYELRSNSFGNSIILVIASLGAIAPFTLPFLLLFCVRFYPKAINNLNNYLDD